METRQLGSLEVSLVGLGCNNFGRRIDAAATEQVVGAALDAGITLFDTADVYGHDGSSELYLGQALGRRRDEAIVATKFGGSMGGPGGVRTGAAPDHVRVACEASLRRLGTDRIDLYQLHQPDAETPIADTLGALNELVVAGKVREIGCSNLSPEQLDEAAAASEAGKLARFVSVQNNLSLLEQDGMADLIDACERHHLGILPYFPLASGLLTGKYRKGQPPPPGTRIGNAPPERQEQALTDRNLELVERLQSFASSQGHTLLELAMSWLAGLPCMGSVIAGATTPDQVRSNAESVQWRLTADERAEVDEITTSR